MSNKYIYDYGHRNEAPAVAVVRNISPYLFEGDDEVLPNRSKPICEVATMRYGNKPTDGGNFILSESQRKEFVQNEPGSARFIRPYLGADEFLEGKLRYCLWLNEITPAELRSLPLIRARVAAVRDFRLKSKALSTRQHANMPTLFRQIAQPNTSFVLVPGHTSEDRKYVPFAYLPPDVIVSNACFMIPDATKYHFGIIASTMHMAWMRTFCGRLESRYRYSKDIVYNNYPWPREATESQKAKVEECAQAVLDARQPFLEAGQTLADLYDPLTMPPPLLKVHQSLDRAVDRCYRKEPFETDRQRVEFLFALYQKLTAPLIPAAPVKKRRRTA